MSKSKKVMNCSKNIICVPFAFKEGANTGVNIRGDAYSVYLKNACVALGSARFNNPDCEVALATNIASNLIPKEYLDVLEKFQVSVLEIPFNNFVMPDNYLWSLAFYKLCVLKELSIRNYKNICYLDTDVYIQGSFDFLWDECEQNIMLYDINHGWQVKDYKIICEEFDKFIGEKKSLTHYGGEFFAASLQGTKLFVSILENIYLRMIKNGFITTKGDEFLVSLSAESIKERVKNAGAYIYRFWTAPGFRLISTCYEYNPVMVLHLPNEKNRGMLKLYKRYIQKGKIPSKRKVWKICRLSSLGFFDRLKQQIIKQLSKRAEKNQ